MSLEEENNSNDDDSMQHGFSIDHGELDPHSKPESFVLGFELGQMYEKFKSSYLCVGVIHTGIMHVDNKDRIQRLASSYNKDIKFRWLNDDWMEYSVSNAEQIE